MALLKNAAIAGTVGLAAGGAHIAAHRTFGNPQAFGPAGVTKAGISVVAASSVVTFAALSLLGDSGMMNAAPSIQSLGTAAYGGNGRKEVRRSRLEARRSTLDA